MSDVVLAATDRPLPIALGRIDDERVPEGMIGLATYLDERLIARCAVPAEVAEFVEQRELFGQPVQLVLAAREEAPGLQCRLYAVVDVNGTPDSDEAEPWAASVPRFEDQAPPEADAEAQGMFFLGQIVRFARDRKHPGDLALETADVLRTLVEGRTNELVDRILDDLLS